MKLGCCIGPEYYDLLARTGYDTITLAAKDVAALSDKEFERVKAMCEAGPLGTVSLNSFCPPGIKLNGRDFDLARLRDYTARLLVRAAGLGVRCIGVGAPGSRNLAPGDDPAACHRQFREALGEMCDLAAPYGIEILLESVCGLECNFITTTREALKVVEGLALPNLGLVYDVYHEFMEKQGPEVVAEAARYIRVVHMAHDIGGRRHYLDETCQTEYKPYLAALGAAGYEGEVSLEAFEGDVAGGIVQSHAILTGLLREMGAEA